MVMVNMDLKLLKFGFSALWLRIRFLKTIIKKADKHPSWFFVDCGDESKIKPGQTKLLTVVE